MKTVAEFDVASGWESESHRTREPLHGDASMSLYMRDIGQVKLLTPQEEIALAARIKQGDRAARERMITANLRLVVKIAQAYEGIGVPLPDLINEGNIGLMRAVERFDPRKGAKLSSYGAWWIKQAIAQALASQSRAIRLPLHVVDRLRKMRRAALRLEEALGREPTDEELAAEVGTTSARVTQMRLAAIRPASLDAPVNGAEDGTTAEMVADEHAESPCDQLEGKALTALLWDIFQTLDEREQTILRLRFGLNGEPATTLEAAAEALGLSRERVRQLQKEALKKLRLRLKNQENNLSPHVTQASKPRWTAARTSKR